ncbi:succinate--CoA ligase [ADP-forming] subunit [Nitrosomonas stercoris]|uniref:Succinate--CoA ligase [ADP-forming] subunit beta n=1 Tax=Nitrosomonas stercoris TaxID=1444684 RepID=A0A4Y1YMB4_9PROT|nr:succinate--CoA ligase [ADP-forming] subunit [Nitrosomonas stercoris]
MKIHEYQAKAILKRYLIDVPAGVACFSVEEAVSATEKLEGDSWVVKAQIYAGGRGKAGGVKLARSVAEVRQYAEEMLFAPLITQQTGPQGQIVRRIYIEQGVEISHEYYVALVIDRAAQCISLIASDAGGMDIEEVAASTPEKIHKIQIDPLAGLNSQDAARVAQQINLPAACQAAAVTMLETLYQIFDDNDVSLLEINPLITTLDNQLIALDAKMNFDENALFRHPEVAALRDPDEEDPLEVEAAQHGLSYIPLDGNIGCLVNGAGLAMATMDIIKLYGGNPANFLDVGGGATVKKVTEAFKLMLKNSGLRAVLVNIFGGIMRCDVIAEGVVSAVHEVKLAVPLVVRLEGTNVELGRKILQDSGLSIIFANNMADAAQKAVDAAAQQSAEN